MWGKDDESGGEERLKEEGKEERKGKEERREK